MAHTLLQNSCCPLQYAIYVGHWGIVGHMLWIRIAELFAVAGFAGMSFLGVQIIQGGKKSALIVALLVSLSLLAANTVLEGETGKGLAQTAYCEIRHCKADYGEAGPAMAAATFLDSFAEQQWNAANSKDLLSSALSMHEKSVLVGLADRGHTRASRLVGSAHLREGDENFAEDEVLAERYLASCADDGSLPCRHNLANLYTLKGNRDPKFYPRAMKLLLENDKEGYTISSGAIGSMYYHGQGVKKNFFVASGYLSKSAVNGDANSAYLLGDIHEFGRHIRGMTDYETAARNYEIAANKGHLQAQLRLGYLNYSRLGNPSEGRRYYCLAFNQGDETAAAVLMFHSQDASDVCSNYQQGTRG